MQHIQTIDAGMTEARAALAAAWRTAERAGDRAEMARLEVLATEFDRLRAQLSLNDLEAAGRESRPEVEATASKTMVPPVLPSDTPAMPAAANSPRPPARPDPVETARVAWAAVTDAKHGPAFRDKVKGIANRIGCDPSHLMAVMAFETGETFSTSIRNAAGSGAVGLIQFMPSTARGLGTSTSALAAMTGVEQLDFVERYFAQFGRHSLPALSDVYMTVLWPAAVGKPESHVLFRKGTRAYVQNRGLDVDGRGTITKGEATARVAKMLARGLQPGRVG